ncbi:MAG: NAD(P)/FAD-dependent oxidoreductase [Hyphomonadaceae bacterium]|nr:NAD(P)/FAD-dependent oxidoreductase [Hyphomonadaceae bacterium]
MAAKKLNVIVIGAGMAGVLAAIKLKQAGDDYVVLEKASSAGGTWRENRYAGLTCDVPAHAYTYSFAPNPEWSRFYANGAEIRAYFDKVIDDYGVRDHILFGREVDEARWENGRWLVHTKNGESYEGDALIAATGVLHHPRMPDIEGLSDFAGDAFHSAQWRDGYDFKGKRVAVIGNGSTGVQIVSALADVAAAVDHYQRSPQWIMPVIDFAYSEEERALFRKDVAAIDAIRYSQEYVDNVRRFNNAIVDPDSESMHVIEQIVRENLEQSVADPELRAKLTPDHRAGCKRLIYSPNYYQRVQLPGVSVVREGIEKIEPTGVRLRNGALRPADVLILATGFHADRFMRPMHMVGRGGLALNDVWSRRPSAYMAVSLPNFPNMFMLNGPTGPVGNFSLIEIAEAQWGYIDQLLARLRAGTAKEISATAAAMADYDERRVKAAKQTIFATGCSSWYLDAEGVPQSWPWTYDSFFEQMRTPQLSAYEIA